MFDKSDCRCATGILSLKLSEKVIERNYVVVQANLTTAANTGIFETLDTDIPHCHGPVTTRGDTVSTEQGLNLNGPTEFGTLVQYK